MPSALEMILVTVSDVYCSDHFHPAQLVAGTFDLEGALCLDSERPGRHVSSAVVKMDGIQMLDAPYAPYKMRCQQTAMRRDVHRLMY